MKALKLEEILSKINLCGLDPKKPEILLDISENALRDLYSALENKFGKSADGYLILTKKFPMVLKSYLEGTFTKTRKYMVEKKKY